MNLDRSIAHLESIKKDIRDEVKQRIEQRDKYSIQLTIGLGGIVAVSFGPTGFEKALIAAPLVSIYFTVLILYSYRIHKILASYCRDMIEPELARLCGTSPDMEWEAYYLTQDVPGIRRVFFMVALWVITVLPPLYLWFVEEQVEIFELTWFRSVLIVSEIVFIVASLTITLKFKRA